MSRFGRRTFLASSAGVAAGAAAGGALPFGSTTGPARRNCLPGRPAAICSAPEVRCGHRALTVNGLTDPVGIDPDGCFFAWTLQVTGRAPWPRRPLASWCGAPIPTRTGVVWDSGTVRLGPAGVRGLRRAALAADAAYEWTVQAQDAARSGGPSSAPARFTTGAARRATGRPSWLRPAGASSQPDRVTYLRTEVTPPAGTVARATAYVSAAHTYRLFVDGAPVDAWPSFSYPDEQYVRAVDLTRAIVAGGDAAPSACCTAGTGPARDDRPPPRPALPALRLVPRRPPRRLRVGRHVAGAPGRMAAVAPAQRRRRRLRGVGGRAGPAAGLVEPRLRRRRVVGGDGARAGRLGAVQPDATRSAPPSARRRSHPVRLHTVAGGAVVADFGAVYAARPRVAFARGEPGSTVTIRAGYLLDPDGQVSTLHGTQGTNLSSSYIMRAGSQAFEAFTYFGFRYLQIDERRASRSAAATSWRLTRHAAMPDVPTATFSSDNRMLNAVWRLSARSCLYCCNEQFVDTPTREKGPFLWDASQRVRGRDARPTATRT